MTQLPICERALAKRSFATVAAATLITLALTGCSGALRSGSIDRLALIESQKIKSLHDQFVTQQPTINKAIDDLKDSYHTQLDARQNWDRQVMDAKLIAAVPGNIKDPITKRAVYIELADLHLNQSDIYATQKVDFDKRADALESAYAKLIDALAQSQKDFGAVASYAGASDAEYAIQSIDTATVGAALSEFQSAAAILASAQNIATEAQPILSAAAKVKTDASVQDFLSVMSQISAQINAIPKK